MAAESAVHIIWNTSAKLTRRLAVVQDGDQVVAARIDVTQLERMREQYSDGIDWQWIRVASRQECDRLTQLDGR